MDCRFGLRAFVGALACLIALFVAGCRDNPPVTQRPDTGSMCRTCTVNAECNGDGICVGGCCQSVTNCGMDQECMDEGKVCHSTREFCVECDGRPGQCPSGKTCQFDYTCVDIASNPDAGPSDAAMCSGNCADRSECAGELVCKNNACCPPPSRCRSPLDCPASRPECNGATGQCFGGGAGCFGDPECETEPGCAGGACFCDIPGNPPAPPGVCRAKPDECSSDMDCFVGGVYMNKYCLLSASPNTCEDSRACTNDTECSSLGLVCDTSVGNPTSGHCINGMPCPTGNECNPTTQICTGGQCVPKNCVNTPSLCAGTEVCNTTTLMCMPAGGCANDTECQTGFYCNLTSTPGTCAPGCRGPADCPNGVCNAAHMCEVATGGVCGPCLTDAECPAGSSCQDVLGMMGVKKCYEACNVFSSPPVDCMLNPNATCIILRCSCL
jgi:hypothetical protein